MAREESGDAPVETAVACGNLIAFAARCRSALPIAGAGAARRRDHPLSRDLFQIPAPYYFLSRRLAGTFRARGDVLLLLEPVLNPVWAWLVHASAGAWVDLGGAVILAATTLRTWADSRRITPPLAAEAAPPP